MTLNDPLLDGEPLPAGRGIELVRELPALVMPVSLTPPKVLAPQREYVAYLTRYFRGEYRRSGRIWQGRVQGRTSDGFAVDFDCATGQGTATSAALQLS